MPVRPYIKQDRTITYIILEYCTCSKERRRGPIGGVCWCGKAIPTEAEDKLRYYPENSVKNTYINSRKIKYE